MPAPPPSQRVGASSLRANAMARQEDATPLGTSARREVSPLTMRMAHTRRRLRERSCTFPPP
jgi:hypothetical protein